MVCSVGFGLPGLPVDTHVTRLTRLLGLTESTDPVRIESDVCALLPRARVGCVQPAADPARPPGLHRPPAPLRRVRPGRLLPVGPAADAAGPGAARAWRAGRAARIPVEPGPTVTTSRVRRLRRRRQRSGLLESAEAPPGAPQGPLDLEQIGADHVPLVAGEAFGDPA